ncbi:MAG: hypothetical protein KAS38_03065 [Anaerolineales bacterium]|nr:hypothetical protein [Anaerolineales bacterium]MCK4978331.1 hypothetical protein [Anaerolineales bacterium]
MDDEERNKLNDPKGMALIVKYAGPDPVKTSREVRAGDLCPQCQEGRLDYDGLLNLACPKCGYALGGCFT